MVAVLASWSTRLTTPKKQASAGSVIFHSLLTHRVSPSVHSDAATINEKAAEYATLQSSVLSAARRGYVDTIIEAEDTRKYVIGAFEMLYTKREERPSKKHGTV